MAEILFDVDGPCGAFVDSLLAHMSADKSLGIVPTADKVVEWDFHKTIFDKVQRDAFHELMENPLFWATMSVEPGAQEVVRKLREAGHQVDFITSPWVTCVGWESARRDWLKAHFDAEFDDVIVCPGVKKHRYHGDILIDDKPSTVKAWQHRHDEGLALLYACTHNRNDPFSVRTNWSYVGSRQGIVELANKYDDNKEKLRALKAVEND